MSPLTETEIVTHLRTRREYCRVLLELSRRQSQLIGNSDYSELLDLITRKQRVLQRLDSLKSRQSTVITCWKETRDTMPEDVRATCSALIDETESLLAELLDQENACTVELTHRRDETRRRLADISGGRQAHEAYHTEKPTLSQHVLDIER